MPDKIYFSNKTRNLVVICLTLFYVSICTWSLVTTRNWINRPFPGFLVLKNNIVPVTWRSEWEGFKRGIKIGDLVVAVNGNPIKSSEELDRYVLQTKVGESLTYSVTRGMRGKQKHEFTIPVTLFTLRDYLIVFLTPLSISIVWCFFGLTIFYLKPNSTASQAFLFTAITVVMVLALVSEYVTNHRNIMPMLGLCLAGPSCIALGLNFPVVNKHAKSCMISALFITSPIIALYIYYYSSYQTDLYRLVDVILIQAYGALTGAIGFSLAIRSFIVSDDPLVLQKGKVVLYGFIVGLIGGIGIIWGALVYKELNIFFAMIPITMVPISIGYALVKHNLFDVDVIIRRSASYLLVSSIAIAFFFAMIAILSLVLQHITGASSQIAAVASTLLMVIIFRPLRARVEEAIDKRFYREKYEYRTTLQKSSEVLISIIDLDQLLSQLIDKVLFAIKIERGGILLRYNDPDRFEVAIGRGYEGANNLALEPDHPVVKILETRKQAVQINDVQAYDEFKEHRELILSMMNNLGLVLIIPILFGRKLIGIFGLSEKKSGEWYSSEDIDLLQTLMNQTAVAIENASKVDELKRMVEVETSYQKLQEVDELKSEFFANVSHEIRTPLTMCLAPLEAMMSGERGQSEKERQEYFSMMHRNMQRLLNLINNLLDFSKLEAGRMKLQVREEDIADLTRYMVGSVESWAERKGVDLSFALDKSLPQLFLDREKMEKVFLNLLSNAIKFTEKGGRIKVLVDKFPDKVRVSVVDTGPGIPESARDKVFDRFAQVEGVSGGEHEGTGIGLALVKEFVELHGGRVWVDSVVGEGSSFRFELPLGKDHLNSERVIFLQKGVPPREEETRQARMVMSESLEEEETTESAPDERPGKDRPLVLVVDDNPDMRRFIKDVVSERFRVELAKDGEEGLNKARELLPALVLSDVMMPKKNGYELCKDLKSDPRTKHLPVILLTARADTGMKIEGLEQGADDYLIKPFNSRELLTRVANLIHVRQVEQQMMESKLSRFLPLEVAKNMVHGNADLLTATKRKKLTIFFSDIRGFTGLSDEMEPEETVELLNEYLTEMTAIVHDHGGTLDKFIGDAIMVFFGDPVDQPDHAVRAVKMAVAMQRRMNELQAQWFKSGRKPLAIGIGINTGYVTVGGIGSEHHMDYTVIGNQVNIAARLQAKAEGGEIIISHATYGEVQDVVEAEDRGEVTVKGIHQPIKIYHLTGIKP